MKMFSALPDDMLKVLGAISVNFNDLERFMDYAIWQFYWNSPSGLQRIVSAGTGINTKCRLFSSAFSELIKERSAAKELADIIKKIRKANDARNLMLHSHWQPEEEGFTRWKLKTNPKLGYDFDEVEMTVEDLEKVADQIYDAADEFYKFISKYESKIFDALGVKSE